MPLSRTQRIAIVHATQKAMNEGKPLLPARPSPNILEGEAQGSRLASDRLTETEIEQLRQHGKEVSAYARKRFSKK